MLKLTFEDLESYSDQKTRYTFEEKCNHKDRNYRKVNRAFTWLQTRRQPKRKNQPWCRHQGSTVFHVT